MESKSKVSKKVAFVAAGVLASSTVMATEASLFSTSDLGSGQELRTNLIDQNSDVILTNAELEAKGIELKCGEGKCGEEKKEEKTEEKKEEKKGEKKAEKKKEEKSKEHKCGEGKCGEGKCGGK